MSDPDQPSPQAEQERWRAIDMVVVGVIASCNVVGYMVGLGSGPGLVLIVGSLAAGTVYVFWRNRGMAGVWFLLASVLAAMAVSFARSGATTGAAILLLGAAASGWLAWRWSRPDSQP
jgi:hypothetical protein